MREKFTGKNKKSNPRNITGKFSIGISR